MTRPVRIRLLQMFGVQDQAWRVAIAHACHEKGWVFHEHWSGPGPVLDPERDSLVVSADAEHEDPDVTDWVVMTTSPLEVMNSIMAHGLERAEALHHASKRLAAASVRVSAGATVVDGNGSEIDLPHLGRVFLGGSLLVEQPSSEGALAMYRTLPPAFGAEARFPLDLMSFPIYRETDDGSNRVNLLGKRRLLLIGPMLFVTPGRWRVDAVFTVDCDVPVHLLLGWGFGTSVSKVDEIIRASGRYQISLSQDWSEVTPAQFTVSLMTPVLEGSLELESVSTTFEGVAH